MKSILFKVSKFPLLSETFVVNQIITAIKLGYDVRILTEEKMDISNCANPALYRKYGLDEKVILEDYQIPSSRADRIKKAIDLVLNNSESVKYLWRYYKVSKKKGISPILQFFFYKSLRKFEVIHIQFGTNKSPIDGLKKIGFLNSKIVVSYHGHDLHFPINNLIPNNGYYRHLFEVADFLICNTIFLQRKLAELGAPTEKIRIIPVAVDTNYFKPGESKGISSSIKIITVGRVDELKGQEYGVAVVNKMFKKGFQLEYFIAGSGPNEYKLKEMVERLQLVKAIHFSGEVKQEEVLRLLQESDIFLMTSIRNSFGMEESQGLVTAEAQACGLPVVAFNSGGIKYTIKNGETGFLCEERDIECLASKIEELILDEELRKKMSDNAVQFIEENYSENSVLEKWRKIYG